MRSEQAIFDDLTTLCSSRGYIHAIAGICFSDNILKSNDDELRVEDMAQMFDKSRLIRTEITTLIGLMMRAPIDFTLPSPETFNSYVEQSKALLEELHQVLDDNCKKLVSEMIATESNINSPMPGECLREVIFYSGESAYSFQYRDLAPRKYSADADWLQRNIGIDLEVGGEICRDIGKFLDRKVMETFYNLKDKPVTEWTLLPGFSFSCDELAANSKQSVQSIRNFLEAFTLPENERNTTFTSLNAFNAAHAYPVIRMGPDTYLLLQYYYGISEAMYESPFYWMCKDKTYAPTALRHRGEFTESFSAERLMHVFGSDRVFQNVEIIRSKKEVLSEIDVLVLFGDRAIVLQAKSKKLTLEARKGNDLQLKDDFKKAVQAAVDQASLCAELLRDKSVMLQTKKGRSIPISERLRTIFPVSVVADHYPALAFQAHQFLNFRSNEQIVPPIVMDVFALDAITEMLTSPLRLLSYLNLRALFGEKLIMLHELTTLSYHLRCNLWLDKNVDLMLLEDDVAMHLDVAMTVRREGIPGTATPDGILTRFEGTPFSRIIAEIEDKPSPAAISLGLMLLELSEVTVQNINDYIKRILMLTKQDGGLHDVTIGITDASTGLTVHCSKLTGSEAEVRLLTHCKRRKDLQKANSWFGIALRPNGSLLFAGELREA